MPRPTKNLLGERFGRLVVTSFVGHIKKNYAPFKTAYWNCKCDCGKDVEVKANSLLLGHTKSCGCQPSQFLRKNYNTLKFSYNGIDRVDNSKGYSVDNCVPCCGRCNKVKGEGTVEDFKEWVKMAYRYQNGEVYDVRN